MTKVIPLAAVPNQRLSFTQGDNRWELEIKLAIKHMLCSVWLNDEVKVLGSRVLAEVPFIPYRRLAQEGNFGILTENNEEPDWRKFGQTQQLVFFDD